MKKTLFALALLAPLGVAAQGYQPPPAQDGPPAGQESEDGFGSMLERGAESLLRDLFRDVEPHMDAIGRELGGRMQALAPLLEDAGNLMDDLRHYQRPERLENGDILIRRKADAPPPPPVSREFQDLADPESQPDPDPLPDDRMPGQEIEL